MPEIFSKIDIIGMVFAVAIVVVAGILLNSRLIDFVTFFLLIIIGLIIPIGRILVPIVMRDILQLEEEKRRVKKDVFDVWKIVWNRMKENMALGVTQESEDDLPSYLPHKHYIIQKFNIYVAEVNLADWMTTVSQGNPSLIPNTTLMKYSAVIVFDLYSGKLVEENYGMLITEWEKLFPEKAEAGWYSRAPALPRIIIPENLLGFLPREALAGSVETSKKKVM